ncbi:hypothetical protein NX059_009222 [Plenodomus lindquistii]|nr:hypothetical protein NX059_009222 [Plenodomus lindquistii]
MADPASIVGTVVGVASLGIQSCQIIHKYYSQHRSYDDDIQQVLEQIRSLEGMLSALRDAKSRVEVDNHEPSSQLHMALGRCEAAVKRLDAFAKKCGALGADSDDRSRFALARDRLLWPFRRETLNELRDNVDNLHQSLTSIFSITGIDLLMRDLTSLSLKTDTVSERTLENGRYLTSIVAQVADLQVAQQQVERRTLVYQEYMAIGLQKLLEYQGHGRIGYPIPSGQHESNTAALESGSLHHAGSNVTLSALTEDISNFGRNKQVYLSPPFVRRQARQRKTVRNQNCQCHYRKSQSVSGGGRIVFLREEKDDHQPHCPRYRLANYSRTVAARITICNRILGFCAVIGWEESRKAGWYGLRPLFKCRNVVSDNEPTFKLVRSMRSKIRECSASDDMMDVMNDTLQHLRHMFAEGVGSPTDVTAEGKSVGEAILELVVIECERNRTSSPQFRRRFLEACFREGIFDGVNHDDTCAPAILYWQYLMSWNDIDGEPGREVLEFLVHELDCCWRPFKTNDQFLSSRERQIYHMTYELLTLDSMKDVLEVESVLLQSILQRSQVAFRSTLESCDIKWLKSVLNTPKYSAPLVCWAQGLSILLDTVSFSQEVTFTKFFWSQACELSALDALEMMSTLLSDVGWAEWDELNFAYSQADDFSDARWPVIFSKLARDLHRAATGSAVEVTESEDGYCSIRGSSLYCTGWLSTLAADALWQAGFHDVNSVSFERYNGNVGTPLWLQVGYCSQWKITSWLIDKGADLNWLHPQYRTTPAHLLSRKRIDMKNLDDHKGWIDEVITSFGRDKCVCKCSNEGCLAVGCVASRSSMSSWESRETALKLVCSKVDRNQDLAGISAAVLRVLTFEELSLTHTCCYRIQKEIWGDFTRPTEEERREIQDIEREDIELLDQVMQEFEEAWTRYPGTFARFIDKVWKPRMRRERKKKKMDQAVMQELGIALKPVPRELAKDEDAEWDSYVEDISESEDDETDTSDDDESANEDDQEGYVTAAEDDE